MADSPTPATVAVLPSSDAHEPAKAWTAQWAGPEVKNPVAYPGNENNPDTRFGEHELPDPQVAIDAGFPPQPIAPQLVVPGHVTQSPLGEGKLIPAPHLVDAAKDVPSRDPKGAVTDKAVVAASEDRDPSSGPKEPLQDPRDGETTTTASQPKAAGS